MKALAIATLVAIGIGSTALAQQQQQQQRSVRDMMADLRARHGQTFEQCQALAISRGYRVDDDNIEHSVMMFIEGCIMGKQR